MKRKFLEDMQLIFPRGVPGEQLRLMTHIYALGWGKALEANGLQNAAERFLRAAEVSLNVPGWTPDDSWRWWLSKPTLRVYTDGTN